MIPKRTPHGGKALKTRNAAWIVRVLGVSAVIILSIFLIVLLRRPSGNDRGAAGNQEAGAPLVDRTAAEPADDPPVVKRQAESPADLAKEMDAIAVKASKEEAIFEPEDADALQDPSTPQGFLWSLRHRPRETWWRGNRPGRNLARMGQEAIPFILEVYRTGSPEGRQAASLALARIGPKAVPPLVEMVRNGGQEREAALRTLTIMGPLAKEALPDLTKALDADGVDRGLLLVALASMGPMARGALDHIVREVQNPDPAVRTYAILALREIHDQPAKLLEVLRPLNDDADPRVRQAVDLSLGRIGIFTEAAIPLLAAFLKDSDAEVRRTSLEALLNLAKLGKDIGPGIPGLRQVFDGDPEPELRSLAAGVMVIPALQKRGSPEALVEVLDRAETGLQAEAAKALGFMGESARAAIPGLQRKLKDGEPIVKIQAALAIWKIEGNARLVMPAVIEALKTANAESGLRAASVLEEILRGPTKSTEALEAIRASDLIPRLASIFNKVSVEAARANSTFVCGTPYVGDDAHVNCFFRDVGGVFTFGWRGNWAARSLAAIGEPAIPTLLRLMKDKEYDARGSAAKALAFIGAPAVRHLLPLTKANDERESQLAFQALSTMETEGKAAIPDLVRMLEQGRPDPKEVLVTLAAMGADAKSALPAIRKQASAKDPGLRTYALLAIGLIGPSPPEDGPLALPFLNDTHPNVREAAISVVWKLRTETATTVPILIELLSDPHREVAEEAAKALGGLGSRSAIPALLRVLDGNQSLSVEALWALDDIGTLSKEAVPLLVKSMKRLHPGAQRRVAEMLGKIGPEAAGAIKCLRDALTDDEASVRMAAAEALGRIEGKPQEYLPVLVGGLRERSEYDRLDAGGAVYRAVKETIYAIPVLLDLLLQGDSWNRASAARALGTFGRDGAPAATALMMTLNDEDRDLRQAAEKALKQIRGD